MSNYLEMSLEDKVIRDIVYGYPYTLMQKVIRNEPDPIHNPHGSTAVKWKLVNGSKTTMHGIAIHGKPSKLNDKVIMQAYDEVTKEQLSSLLV